MLGVIKNTFGLRRAFTTINGKKGSIEFENSFKAINIKDIKKEEIDEYLQVLLNFAKTCNPFHIKPHLYKDGIELLNKLADLPLSNLEINLDPSQRNTLARAQKILMRKDNGMLNDLYLLSKKKPCKFLPHYISQREV